MTGVLIIHSFLTVTAYSQDDKLYPEDEGVYLWGARTAVGTETGKTGGAYTQSGIPLGKMRIPSDKLERDDKGTTNKGTENRGTENRGTENNGKDGFKFGISGKKERITLKAVPEDGIVSLTWTTTGLKLKPESTPFKFTLFYGLESGRYDKKLEIGTATEFKLRELKNNQIYFIKIQGYTSDNTLSIFSNEVSVIPLPDEEAGSLLERSYAANTTTLQDKLEADPFKRKLRQFGYDFFQNSLLIGSASENLPVGEEYILGPGDSVHIDVWGSINSRSELQVDRNGEITIPKVGTVKLWGVSYSQAKEVINRAISKYFKGYGLNVTLGRLRTIQVYVVGDVKAPGTYTISSLGTLINALSLAGGPSKTGSLRTIKLLKKGKVVEMIDLYDMLLSGDRSKDARLENGDTIFVPVIGPVVAVAGEVKRPAIYELKGKTTLKRLLKAAGGITASGYTGRIQVERFEGNSARIALDYVPESGPTDDKLSTVEIQDRDMVKIFPVNRALRRVVTVKGSVARPGEYQFKEGMRLLDLIPNYEALQPETYLGSVKLIRLALPDFHKEALSCNLAKALAGDLNENILLQEQDTVIVYSRMDAVEKPFVSISGEVLHPGFYDFYDNLRVRDLITDAGSLKMNAYLERAELTRILTKGGVASSIRMEINLPSALAGDPLHNLILQPNDSLIVRGISNWLEANNRFVTLKGEVTFPGIYSIMKGEKFSSVITRAGGFTNKSYLHGAKFTRRSVQESQQKRMDEIIAKSEKDILNKQAALSSLAASKEELEATRASLESLLKSLEKLKAGKAEGRVVIHLASLDEFKRTPYDIELMGGDILEIPVTPNVVNVMGDVYNTTTLIHMPDKKVAYYLQKAGGPTRDADESQIYVIKADGTVMSREQSSFGIRWDEEGQQWNFGGFMATSVEPGDTLVVPKKIERIAWLREIKDITTIISQIALTAGMVLVGLK